MNSSNFNGGSAPKPRDLTPKGPKYDGFKVKAAYAHAAPYFGRLHGARVASQRCPILRAGFECISHCPDSLEIIFSGQRKEIES